MSKGATARLFLALVAGFMVATVAGTLSHEGGHYLASRILGYHAAINYMSTTWPSGQAWMLKESVFITWGGPLQTMLTGTLGLLLLLLFRRSFQPEQPLTFWQWLLVFLSLFWLRQPANLAMGIGIWLFTRQMPGNDDETFLSDYYQLPASAILLLTALMGALILALVFFRFVPRGQRILFMASSLLGGVAGYTLWFYYLGPVIMP